MIASKKCVTKALRVISQFVTTWVVLFLWSCGSVLAGNTSSHQVVLNFPKSAGTGVVYLLNPNHVFLDGLSDLSKAKPVAAAKGSVSLNIKEGESILLGLDYKFFKHPDVLKNLNPDSVYAVKLLFTCLDDSENSLWRPALQSISRLNLTELELNNADVSDEDLTALKSMKSLVRLALSTTPIKGNAFKSLSQLPNLRELDLQDVRVSPQFYKDLCKFPNLSALALTRTNIGSEELQHLSACSRLKSLRLNKNPDINDDCMKYLLPLQNLAYLDLQETAVTFEGLKLLRHNDKLSLNVDTSKFSAKNLVLLRQMFPKSWTLGYQPPLKTVDRDATFIFKPLGQNSH